MKKIFCSLILLLILPIKISAIQIDQDINSGIILSAEENVLPTDTIIRVNSINNENTINVANNFGFSIYNAYTISILNNENNVFPTDSVKLSFPLLDIYNVNDNNPLYILKINNNGIVETTYTNNADNNLYKRYSIDNNYATITINSFSTETEIIYLVGTQNSLINTTIDNPKTLDNSFFSLILVSIIGVIGILLLFIKLYIDNKEKI